jgi:prepilin-type N-terminal cleavage/methylation domain-containing protein
MNRRRSQRSFAFTLPEVLVSLALVGLVIPGVMRGVSLALAASDDARKRIEAVGLAESKLEEMTAAVVSNRQGSSSAGDFGVEHSAFRWDSTANVLENELTEIRVNVRWTARGSERSVALSTFAYAGTATIGATAAVSSASGGTP